jgi:hypothetical protein
MLGPDSVPHEANALAQQLVAKALRVAELRKQRAIVSAAAVEAQAILSRRASELVAGAEQLKQACASLHELSEALPCMDTAIEGVRGEVSLLSTLISAKQLALVADLRQLYPISEMERGRTYSIRGLSMPHRDSFHLLQVGSCYVVRLHAISILKHKFIVVAGGTPIYSARLHRAHRFSSG